MERADEQQIIGLARRVLADHQQIRDELKARAERGMADWMLLIDCLKKQLEQPVIWELTHYRPLVLLQTPLGVLIHGCFVRRDRPSVYDLGWLRRSVEDFAALYRAGKFTEIINRSSRLERTRLAQVLALAFPEQLPSKEQIPAWSSELIVTALEDVITAEQLSAEFVRRLTFPDEPAGPYKMSV